MSLSLKLIARRVGAWLGAGAAAALLACTPTCASAATPANPTNPIRIAPNAQDAAAREAAAKAAAARAAARDNARENVRDARENARDNARDSVDKARDTRVENREARRDERRYERPERAADVGLWFRRAVDRGLTIADVASNGAISRLGFREGDVIVSVNGHKVAGEREFLGDLFPASPINGRVAVVVNRGGREETIYVEPQVLDQEYTTIENDPLENFGLTIDDRYPDRIVVWKVLPRSAAYYAGIRPGDVIRTFHNKPVTSLKQFTDLVRDTAPGEIQVEVNRNDKTRKLDADMPKFEARTQRQTTFRQDLDRRDQPQPKSADPTAPSLKPTLPPTPSTTPLVPPANPAKPLPPTNPTTSPVIPKLPLK
ncbi:MAG TPA: PDZ domain-containing protein [Pirellulales bacterium]|jgi:C-terminal processing protease CtpA/Prc|nr:PDZ domain-containing protein [Pirellulales bacterium]